MRFLGVGDTLFCAGRASGIPGSLLYVAKDQRRNQGIFRRFNGQIYRCRSMADDSAPIKVKQQPGFAKGSATDTAYPVMICFHHAGKFRQIDRSIGKRDFTACGGLSAMPTQSHLRHPFSQLLDFSRSFTLGRHAQELNRRRLGNRQDTPYKHRGYSTARMGTGR
jgi:hypothetical protein